MAAKMQVAVVTPEKAVSRGEFEMVIAPSIAGEVGILAEHRPLLAGLAATGVVELRREGLIERYAVSGGFLEVQQNHVTLLAETAERADLIDVDRSKHALEDAEARLKKLDPIAPEYADQMQRAARARTRLGVAAGVKGVGA